VCSANTNPNTVPKKIPFVKMNDKGYKDWIKIKLIYAGL